MSDNRVLVPVSESRTLRQTIEYAANTALDADDEGVLRLVYVHPATHDPEHPDEQFGDAETLLDRAAVWASDDSESITVETAHLGTERYIFSPDEVADAIASDARRHGISHIVMDREYDPGIGTPLLRPLAQELAGYAGFAVEEVPSRPPVQRSPLLERTSLGQMGAIFVISFAFYQILAGQLYWFDLLTGVVSAAIVAVGLSRVTFSRDPTGETLARIARHTIYIPYLLKEIIKSNIVVAAVILHPRLPIEPRMTRIKPALWGALPMTTFANSVTLTPGTLSVRIDGRDLIVHTLLPDAREDLFDGGLERAVRFVFYGREATSLASPRERGEAVMIGTDHVSSASDQDLTDDSAHASSDSETDPTEANKQADAQNGESTDTNGGSEQ